MAEYSPMMQHYLDTKNEYKDCILFYRLGDFYEMFFDDAILLSKELELTLTGKLCGQEEKAPMCGVPHHSADTYIQRLILKGYKVAICEQVEDPKNATGIVKREVIRVVTPGTVMETTVLEEKKNNYLMSIYKSGIYFGITLCDITTGDFKATQIKQTNNFACLLDEISKFSPSELIVNQMLFGCSEEVQKIKERFDIYITNLNEEDFSDNLENITQKMEICIDNGKTLKNLKDYELCVYSTNAMLKYILDTQKNNLEHINSLEIYNLDKYMSLDINARRNLEITEKMRDKSKKGTLLWVLDKTSTAMGGRLLRRWLNEPLIDENEINLRLLSVEELKSSLVLKGDLIESLNKVYDMERLAGKIAYGSVNARDLISLKNSITKLPEIKDVIKNTKSPLFQNLYKELDELIDVYELIDSTIIDEPPISVKEGNIIKLGYNEEIDTYKKASTDGKYWLVELEAKERELTGIKTLKVGFNKVFGYFIEVTKSNVGLVPDRFTRKQTLTNCERYITEDLKNIENSILRSSR